MRNEIISANISLFFLVSIPRPDLHFNFLELNNTHIFNGIPTSQDIPQGIPVEIPIKTLKSNDGRYLCNIGRNRIDFICQRINSSETNEEIIERLSNIFDENIKQIQNNSKLVRIAFVSNLYFSNLDPIRFIRDNFLPSLPKNAIEAGFNYNERSNFKNFHINDIINISAGFVNTPDTQNRALLVQRDINNVPYQNKNELSSRDIKEIKNNYFNFISESSISKILKLES